MSRGYRRRDPVLPRKEKVSLSEGHIALRLLAVGAAILIAAVSFSRVIGQLTSVQTGWQEIEPANPRTGIQTQMTLLYEIGTGSMAAAAELRTVSAHYSDALDHAYQALANVPAEQFVNLSDINASPNSVLTVDPILYAALEKLESSTSRYIYYGPLFGQYDGIYAAADDIAAEKFDPYRSEAVGEYASEIAAFAQDPAAIQVHLLGENTVLLAVSDAYLAYAADNEIDTYVDFGALLNAFLVDAAADELCAYGCTSGILTSCDGFARVLGEQSCSVDLYDTKGGRIESLHYAGPAGLAVFRSFPLRAGESYHVYEDGTLVGPYVAADGYPRSAATALAVLGDRAADAAICGMMAFAADSPDEIPLAGFSWALQSGSSVTLQGNGFSGS